ncbi:MAG: TetR/AcrR family transcriptional regulator [Desertimonas sp.]
MTTAVPPPAPPPTEAALLDAFEHEAASSGLANVGLRSVARRAGLSHAAPGHVFGSLAGMQRAAAERACLALGAAVEQARADVGDPFDALVAEGFAVIDWALASPVRFDLLFRAGGQVDAVVHEMRGMAYRCFVTSVECCVAPERVADVALEVWATTIGLASVLLDDRSGSTELDRVHRIIAGQIDRLRS